MKDSRGDITLEVPISGSLSDKRLDWGETIWAAVKQVLVKVLASPFRSIGRLFTGGEDNDKDKDKVEGIKVDPVVFAAGSSVVGPAMEGHLNRVGQFLRDTPAIALSLSPVVTAKDFDGLRGQELTTKIQRLQRERGIPDYEEAVGSYYLAQNIPGPIPKTANEQLKALQAREQLPEERITELLDRRVAAARDRLTKTESVGPERLLPGEPHVFATDTGTGASISPSPRNRAKGSAPGGSALCYNPPRSRAIEVRRNVVPHYVMLSTLSESGRKVLRERPGWVRKVNRELEAKGARVRAQFAVLGPYDFVTILEAPDNETVSAISIEMGARGSVQMMTMPAIPLDTFINRLAGRKKSGARRRARR